MTVNKETEIPFEWDSDEYTFCGTGTVHETGYIDPGHTNDIPENCYPPEHHIEVTCDPFWDINIDYILDAEGNDVDINLQWVNKELHDITNERILLTTEDLQEIADYCCAQIG